MNAQLLARQLFAPPGAAGAPTRHLLAQAAGSHARLLASSVAAHRDRLDTLRAAFEGYLRGPAPSSEKRELLDDPQLIEALHALASTSPTLTDWDQTVAPGCGHAPPERETTIGCGRLGNIVAALSLRRVRHWQGRMELATDVYGRVHFPFCDWVLVLVDEHDQGRELAAHQPVVLELDERAARWSIGGDAREPLVDMPRDVFETMFINNRTVDGPINLRVASSPYRPRFERASRLGRTRIRFEPISRDAPALRAELTGGILAQLVAAIERNAPRIHEQLCQCIRRIHGFELPPHATGHLASFSVPTCPGVIGFNVEYTAADEPRLDPYCFMWLGHELGHTLHYLIDDVAFTHGWRLLENPGDVTPTIPRYGRALRMRTLFQVPYVHLFEWWLLIEFHQRRYSGLPWPAGEAARVVGNDLRAEIDEAFDMLDQHARLTPLGRAVIEHLRRLTADALRHWRRHFRQSNAA
jgi:hypothetical protein